ncbi:MAG TPA: CpsB/CapC family capsule biosynthesis tyrosine phosphatase [Candidatus Angelobacter sp.]|nr:CpsB/CapC family capsule biosynthesis tyrosine phosphatase [Candidatus Angelobacter sp.]
MIDLHCHILPGVDDGPRSWDVARQMCDIAARDGITHLVATPHANAQFPYNRKNCLAMLDRLRAYAGNRISFSLGCDFHVSCENTQSLFADPGGFTIDDTGYLLVELADFGIPPNFASYIARLRHELRITPILTHPERHPILRRTPEMLRAWIQAGCLIQVTANSLSGFWGRTSHAAAMWLLKNGMVHILATDAHDPKHRPPILSEAVKIAASVVGSQAASAMVNETPGNIIAGQPNSTSSLAAQS